MESSKNTKLTRVILIGVAILFFATLFFPVWRIELTAPQYPEGLVLQLYANKIGGTVDIINGLNHYIGMKTLHTDDFIEFKVLPYILGAFGLFSLLVAFLFSKRALYALWVSFVTFGVLAAVDFYRWNYEYGHNLDPSAPIKVPGMAYQPPLLGYKQLLNFGAYSIPDIGGCFLIFAGVLLTVIVAKEKKWFRKIKLNKLSILTGFLLLFSSSCNQKNAEPIKLHSDACDFCKMTITDGRYGGELLTKKGRVYKFDDLGCMLAYVKENKQMEVGKYFVHDFEQNNVLIDAETAFFLHSEQVNSPMQGNTIAFTSLKKAEEMMESLGGSQLTWLALQNK